MLKLPIIGLGSCLLFGTAAWAAEPLEIRTGTLATRYLQVWSSDGATSVRSVPDLYERRVTFYGQQYTHHQLMAEKRRAIRRWPVRRYAHRPGTLRIKCDRRHQTCMASSIIVFAVANPPRGLAKHGSAKFALGINFAGPHPRIFYEGGSVNSRRTNRRA
jgi:hypothetical protein